jgi:hypothetical protein
LYQLERWLAPWKMIKGGIAHPLALIAVDDCCPLPVAWLDLLWLASSLRSCDDCSDGYLAHYEACLVEVVRVVVLDAILDFNVGYKAEPALDHLRVLAEGSLVVVLAIRLHYKLWLVLNKRTRLV